MLSRMAGIVERQRGFHHVSKATAPTAEALR
jgi:hypothetical protein